MNHFKLVHGTTAPSRYTKIVFIPGKDTKFVKQYQEAEYVSRYTKLAAPPASWTPPVPPDEPLVTVWGSQWITKDPFYANSTAIAKTAVYSGGIGTVDYRYRTQKRITGGDGSISNGPWSSYDNTGTEVSGVLPAAGYDVRFQSQATDSESSDNEFTGWKQIKTQPTIGNFYFMIGGELCEGDLYTATPNETFTIDCALSGGNATDITYKWSIKSGGAGIINGSTNEQCTVDIGDTYVGQVQVQLVVSSNTSSDSPVTKVLTAMVPQSYNHSSQ